MLQPKLLTYTIRKSFYNKYKNLRAIVSEIDNSKVTKSSWLSHRFAILHSRSR